VYNALVSSLIYFMETGKRRSVQELGPNELMKVLDDVLQRGTTRDLEALFDEGMRVDQTDFEGRTSLQLASFKGDNERILMLFRRGADVNKVFMYQGRIPMSALDAAREGRKKETEKMLLEHGAKTGKELTQTSS